MKVLVISQTDRELLDISCINSLNKLGHETSVFYYGNESKFFLKQNLPFLFQAGIKLCNIKLKKFCLQHKPDVLFTIKGETIFPWTIEWIKKRLKIPTILWFTDDPPLFERVSQYISPAYDYVFTSSEHFIPNYKQLGVKNIEYIPFSCDPSFHKKMKLTEEEKQIFGADLCFAGNFYPDRERILKHLLNFDIKIYGSHWKSFADLDVVKKYNGYAYGENLVKLFNATKIVLNIHSDKVKYDGIKANLRTFEATGCGSFLLTDKPQGLEDFFKIGKELVCYENLKELIELIEFYLENDKEREKIAREGQKRAYGDHTTIHRMKKIILTI
jgi:spore maturation protein CgeB